MSEAETAATVFFPSLSIVQRRKPVAVFSQVFSQLVTELKSGRLVCDRRRGLVSVAQMRI